MTRIRTRIRIGAALPLNFLIGGLARDAIMEVELKLLLDPAAVKAVQHHPLLKQLALDRPHVRRQSDVYFDTPDLQLRAADAGLRVRRVGGQAIQTLKAGGSVRGGLHSRNEWELPVADERPDLAAMREAVGPDTGLGKLLQQVGRGATLVPVFTVESARTVWMLRLEQGDEVECVLDQGHIATDGGRVPLCELELELVRGNPVHLYDLALQLLADVPMRIGTLSKAARGYLLHAGQAGQAASAVGAAVPALSKRMTVEQAMREIGAGCLAQIQANEAGVVEAGDAESVHQMRVGLRRLRSALALFRDAAPLPEALQPELDWLSGQLGDARDWEVLGDSTLPRLEAPPALAAAEALGAAVDEWAHRLHRDAATAICSPRYTSLMLQLARWLLDANWRAALPEENAARLDQPLPKFARKQLHHGQRRLLKRGHALHRAGGRRRHRARIAAKKARYAAEFFQLLYPKRRLRRYVAALERLQDELGRLNDAAVADRLLQQLQDAQPELAAPAAFVRGYLAASLDSDAAGLRKRWKKFTQARPPC